MPSSAKYTLTGLDEVQANSNDSNGHSSSSTAPPLSAKPLLSSSEEEETDSTTKGAPEKSLAKRLSLYSCFLGFFFILAGIVW